MSLLSSFQEDYHYSDLNTFTVEEYLEKCRDNPMYYANAVERLLDAIGEPEYIDTAKDPRLRIIFSNQIIKRYKPFAQFFGMEKVIEQIVRFFTSSAQGSEESKQILYLLGPVGGGKSSIAETLKALMCKRPFYTIRATYKDEHGREVTRTSPCYESIFGLFTPEQAARVSAEYGIPENYMKTICSPWANKRMHEFKGDITRFEIVEMYPSQLDSVGVTKTEPGDENNQDITSLVGKPNLRMLEYYDQHDADCYSFSGALNRATQGMMEFVEMFKAPIKVLHPLLTATQERNYNCSEPGMGAVPYDGILLAHSNQAEWDKFKNNKDNEAFIDRCFIIKVPYCLRVSDEMKIYQKNIDTSKLMGKPCAPDTLHILADLVVASRLEEPENSTIEAKLKTYDGEDTKDTDVKNGKSYTEYKNAASFEEGMTGISTRNAFKIISKVFNYDANGEVAANPVHMLAVLEDFVAREFAGNEKLEDYKAFLKRRSLEYFKFLEREIKTAYFESFSEYGQNIFDQYVQYADFWMQNSDYRDPDTGELMKREALNEECEKVEKASGIANPKDFRNEIVNYVLRYRADNAGRNPVWNAYRKLGKVIEDKMFSAIDDIMPVISFGTKANQDDAKKHENFVARMCEAGYTEKQVRLLVEWYFRYKKAQ